MAEAWARTPRRIEGAIAKSDEWLCMSEIADAAGTTSGHGEFLERWRSLISAAEGGRATVLDGNPVRMMPCTQTNGVDRWCVHRSQVSLFAPTRAGANHWTPQPSGWLTLKVALSRLQHGVDPDVFVDAWRAMVAQAKADRTPEVMGITARLRPHALHGLSRWLMHADDIAPLAAVLRGKLPNLRRSYLSPGEACSRMTPDARSLAFQLLKSLGETRRSLAMHAQHADTATVRRFLVNGRPTYCLNAECLPAFLAEVTTLYDHSVLRGIDVGEDDDQDEISGYLCK